MTCCRRPVGLPQHLPSQSLAYTVVTDTGEATSTTHLHRRSKRSYVGGLRKQPKGRLLTTQFLTSESDTQPPASGWVSLCLAFLSIPLHINDNYYYSFEPPLPRCTLPTYHPIPDCFNMVEIANPMRRCLLFPYIRRHPSCPCDFRATP